MPNLSAYRFASDQKFARRGMAWYARMFEDGPVVDFGAGRGHFLEAIKARGLEGRGVDIDSEAVMKAQGIGIDISLGDGFLFLASQSDLGGIFVSHVVEHFDPASVGSLLRDAYRALRHNGTLVIVTPNPGDWMVLSEIFWLDPTHVRPYPVRLMAAMLESAGFAVEATGLRPTALGLRPVPSYLLNRIRFGRQYGRGEGWLRGRKR